MYTSQATSNKQQFEKYIIMVRSNISSNKNKTITAKEHDHDPKNDNVDDFHYHHLVREHDDTNSKQQEDEEHNMKHEGGNKNNFMKEIEISVLLLLTKGFVCGAIAYPLAIGVHTLGLRMLYVVQQQQQIMTQSTTTKHRLGLTNLELAILIVLCLYFFLAIIFAIICNLQQQKYGKTTTRATQQQHSDEPNNNDNNTNNKNNEHDDNSNKYNDNNNNNTSSYMSGIIWYLQYLVALSFGAKASVMLLDTIFTTVIKNSHKESYNNNSLLELQLLQQDGDGGAIEAGISNYILIPIMLTHCFLIILTYFIIKVFLMHGIDSEQEHEEVKKGLIMVMPKSAEDGEENETSNEMRVPLLTV